MGGGSGRVEISPMGRDMSVRVMVQLKLHDMTSDIMLRVGLRFRLTIRLRIRVVIRFTPDPVPDTCSLGLRLRLRLGRIIRHMNLPLAAMPTSRRIREAERAYV